MQLASHGVVSSSNPAESILEGTSMEPIDRKRLRPGLSVGLGGARPVDGRAAMTARPAIPATSPQPQTAIGAEAMSKVPVSGMHGLLCGASPVAGDAVSDGLAMTAVAGVGPAEHRAHLQGAAMAARPEMAMLPARPTTTGAAPFGEWKTTIATANVLEVGVPGGSHGWLRVRAELGQSGEVMASVLTSSAGAAEGLHKVLPGLTAFLAGEQVGVGSLVVSAAGGKGGVENDGLMHGGDGRAGTAPEGGSGQNDRRRTISGPWRRVRQTAVRMNRRGP